MKSVSGILVMRRRSRFELCMEIIDLCNSPGLTRSSIVTKANINSSRIREILFGLIEDRLLKTETRKYSPAGGRLDTDYYIRTREGDDLIKDFKNVRSRITKEGPPSAQGTQRSKV